MGHEISTTTLQLARACSVIANGGFLVRPVIVKGRDEGQRVQVIRPEERDQDAPDDGTNGHQKHR